IQAHLDLDVLHRTAGHTHDVHDRVRVRLSVRHAGHDQTLDGDVLAWLRLSPGPGCCRGVRVTRCQRAGRTSLHHHHTGCARSRTVDLHVRDVQILDSGEVDQATDRHIVSAGRSTTRVVVHRVDDRDVADRDVLVVLALTLAVS